MSTDNLKKEQTEDWIEHIVDKVHLYYMGRKVILWGDYYVSDIIKDRLKKKYGLNVAFYVDGNAEKIDNVGVFSPKCLFGKALEYYVVIPLAFHQSVKDEIVKGGYESKTDYYYFSDCVVCQGEDYYEDNHGNKIIGKYWGLKFAFSGFNSTIEIGDNVRFQNTCIYVHNDSKIIIDNDCFFQDSRVTAMNSVKMKFKYGNKIIESNVVAEKYANLEIENACNILHFSLYIGKQSRVVLGEKGYFQGKFYDRTDWIIGAESELIVGSYARFENGIICMLGKNQLKFGEKFTIRNNYDIRLDEFTSILIGDDCLFSRDIMMRGNDGHSIFDITTGRNINSTPHISKSRKIIIGDHVWVGMRATILYHTIIKSGSIVGAMSLVKNTFPNNCILAGIPAKVINENIAWSDENGMESILACGEKYVNHTEYDE